MDRAEDRVPTSLVMAGAPNRRFRVLAKNLAGKTQSGLCLRRTTL
jgi:hypothetical protein